MENIKEEILQEVQNNEQVVEKDLEEFGKNLSEFQELKMLEEQFAKSSTDLSKAKDQLSNLEVEIKQVREEEIYKKERISNLFAKGKEKEISNELEDALDYFLEILEIEPKNPRAIYYIQSIKRKVKDKENQRIESEREAKKRSLQAKDLFESAKRYYRENNFEKALDEVNESLNVGGKNSEIVEFREKCELRINEIEEALNKAKKESEEKKRMVNEYMIASNAHIRREEYAEGLKLLEKALFLMPDNKEVQQALRGVETKYKEILSEEKKSENIKQENLKKIRELQIKAYNFSQNFEYEKAIRELEGILLIDSKASGIIDEIKNLTEKHVAYKKSIEEKNEKIERDKKDAINYLKQNYGQGVGYYTINEFRKASEAFSLVMSKDPHYEEVESYMVKIETKLKEKEQQEIELQKKEIEAKTLMQKKELEELKLKEEKIRELFELGMKAYNNDNYEEALNKLEKCIALDPEKEIYQKELLNVRDSYNEYKKELAIEKKKKEEEQKEKLLLQEKVEALLKQADNYFKNAFYDDAIELYNTIIDMDSSSKAALEGIIKCQDQKRLLVTKNEQELRDKELLEKEIFQNNFEAEVLYKSSNYDEAIKKWEKVIEKDPLNETAQKGIINAKKKLHDIKICSDAQTVAEKFIKNELKRIQEIDQSLKEAKNLFQKGEFSNALNIWNNISKSPLSQEI